MKQGGKSIGKYVFCVLFGSDIFRTGHHTQRGSWMCKDKGKCRVDAGLIKMLLKAAAFLPPGSTTVPLSHFAWLNSTPLETPIVFSGILITAIKVPLLHILGINVKTWVATTHVS